MNTTKPNLEAVLDRVPLSALRAAIARRAGKSKITASDLAEYAEVLDTICQWHDIAPRRVLSDDPGSHAYYARCAFYGRLHYLGWTVQAISQATGHNRTRVIRGLKKRGVRVEVK